MPATRKQGILECGPQEACAYLSRPLPVLTLVFPGTITLRMTLVAHKLCRYRSPARLPGVCLRLRAIACAPAVSERYVVRRLQSREDRHRVGSLRAEAYYEVPTSWQAGRVAVCWFSRETWTRLDCVARRLSSYRQER